MSRYRKIDACLWSDRDFRALSEDGQRLWFYLLTGLEVTSLPGLLIAGRAQLAERLRWTQRRFDEAFAELAETRREDGTSLAMADWDEGVVWLPRAIVHNKPANPNAVRGWKVPWDAVPDCDLKASAYDAIRAALTGPLQKEFDAFAQRPALRPSAKTKQLKLGEVGPLTTVPPSNGSTVSPSVPPSDPPSVSRACARVRAPDPDPAPVPASDPDLGAADGPDVEPDPDDVKPTKAAEWTAFDSSQLAGIFVGACPFTISLSRFDKEVVGNALRVHGPKDRKELEAWVQAVAPEFAPFATERAAKGKLTVKFAIDDWLNARAASKSKPRIRAAPRASEPPPPVQTPEALETRRRASESLLRSVTSALASPLDSESRVRAVAEVSPPAATQGEKP